METILRSSIASVTVAGISGNTVDLSPSITLSPSASITVFSDGAYGWESV